MATTIYRLAEECQLMLSGGKTSGAFNPTIDELKIAVAQVANTIFKVEHLAQNLALDERIPNGTSLGTYTGIEVSQYGNNVSMATLPAMPIKLPRDVGCFSIYPTNHPELEFVPIQMGQANLLRSQPSFLNDLAGHIGYERQGLNIYFTRDITVMQLDEEQVTTIEARLAIMDFSAYDDWTPIPVPAEQEWEIKKQVVAMYSTQPIADKVVDPGVASETGIPTNKQRQA
jgi:hypothetical protein